MRRSARADATADHAADAALSRAPSATFSADWLRRHLRKLVGPLRGRCVCVAYSGGLDSCALLAALAALRVREGFRLRAVHINHQLHPQAARWAQAARSVARSLRVPCQVIEVQVLRERGDSLEAQARAARYQALRAQLTPGELLLTAHHQDDQLETVLLALIRGSGVRGLAAIPAVSSLHGVELLRPLLPVARPQLERYLRRRGLPWICDPSNQDPQFDRNYLRHCVVPLLRARWPAVAATASRSAAHLAEARQLLDQLAQHSLLDAHDGATLRVSALRRLSPAQRRNALRWWLAVRSLPVPDQARLRELAGPLLSARADSLPRVTWPGAEVRRHGDRLIAARPTDAQGLSGQTRSEQEPWNWQLQPWLPVGAAGSIGIVADRHGDLQLSALPAVLQVTYRRGGERLHAAHGHLQLKDLLQQRGVSPWLRSRVPLLMHSQHIIAVGDLWLDPRYVASGPASRRGGDARGRVRWRRPATEVD